MKNFRFISAVLFAGILFITGCQDVFSPPEQSGSTAGNVIVKIGVGDSGSARTLHPEADVFTKYELTFSGPVPHDPVSVNPGTPKELTLSEGTWTITATAYTGTEGSYTVAAKGSWNNAVTTGETVNADIRLSPISDGDPGTLDYSVTLPASLKSAVLTLKTAEGETKGSPIDLAETGKDSDTISLSPGSYLLIIHLTDNNDDTAGRTEAVHIYPNLTTEAVYHFNDDDFLTGGNDNLEEKNPDPDDVKAEMLPVPTGLTAEALSVSAVRISWNAVEGANGYDIYWYGDLGDGDGEEWYWVDDCEETSYTEVWEGFEPETSYKYAVFALNSQGYSIADSWEDEWANLEGVSVTIPAAPIPETPPDPEETVAVLETPVFATDKSITLTRNEEGVTLLWQAVSGATSYKIYRANVKNTSDHTYLGTVSASLNAYDDASVNLNSVGTSYYYVITAVNSAGVESEKSAPHGFTVTKPVVYAYNSAQTTSGTSLLGSFLNINNMEYSSYTSNATLAQKRNGVAHQTQHVSLNPGTYTYKTRYYYYKSDSDKGLTSWVDRGNQTLKPLHTYKIAAVSGKVNAVVNLQIEK